MPKARTPLDYDRYQELHAQGLSLRQIAKELGIPESTLRDNLKMMQKAQASHGLPPSAHAVEWGEDSPSPRTATDRTAAGAGTTGSESSWQPGCKNGSPINGQTATINSLAVWSPKTRPSSGPKMAIERSPKPLGRALPALDTLSFGACSPTSALQAVGSSSKFLRGSPPRPAQHVGASPVPLATQACK